MLLIIYIISHIVIRMQIVMIIMRYCGPSATKCNVCPGTNLGFNLTGVACYCTLPDMGTQWPDNRRGSVWPSAVNITQCTGSYIYILYNEPNLLGVELFCS